MSQGNDVNTLFDGEFVRVMKRDQWEFVTRKRANGVVAIIPVTDDGKLVLVEQYRPPLDRNVIELPAGLVGDVDGAEDEDLSSAAARELEEETGYKAAIWVPLCAGPISSGLSDETITMFLATGLTKSGPGGGDDSEDITVHEVPTLILADWLAQREAEGLAVDIKVQIARASFAAATYQQGEEE